MTPLDPHRLELGEGPGFDPASGTAWWFDIPARRMYLHTPGAGTTRVVELPFAASAMAVTPDGRHLLVAEDGLYLRAPKSGALTLHLPLEADNPVTRSNDARVHPSGALWIGTMGWQVETGAGAWYHYLAGKITPLWSGVTIPNAVCFAPDGCWAYLADTPTGCVMRVATDPVSGMPRGEPLPFLDGLDGPPDGAVSDREGNIWVALWGTGRVAGFTPAGRALGAIALPVANVTCPAFLGRGARQMLVTSARYGMSAEEREAAPLAGATFLCPLDFAGRFDPPVRIGP